MKQTIGYGQGYIERRSVLLDGSLPAGEPDADKPRKTMYFAQLDRPHLWYGPLRDTEDEAISDGQKYCEKIGISAAGFGIK